MKKFTITITGECPDEITDDQLAEVASAAEVQVVEPQIENPDDSWNPLEFKTENVHTSLTLGNGPMVIVVRVQDAPNDFALFPRDAAVEVHDIDMGYMNLDDPIEFVEWAAAHLQVAVDLKSSRPEAAEFIERMVLISRRGDFADMTVEQLLAAAEP